MAEQQEPAKRQFVNFSFHQVDPLWRRLPHDQRQAGKQEFVRAIEEFSGKIIIVPYTTVGIRGDCDFMLPEPSTMLLLGSGLAGLVAWRMKKAKV